MTPAHAAPADQSRDTYSTKALLACALAVGSTLVCLASIVLTALGAGWAALVIIALPVAGGLAVTLAWRAMREIRASAGRLQGRAPALVGMFLGLLSAVMQGSFGVGALLVYSAYPGTLRPVAARLFVALDRDEPASAAMFISTSTQAPGVDRQKRIAAALRDRFGKCLGAEFDLSLVLESRRFASAIKVTGAVPTAENLRPVRLVYERRKVLALLWLDNVALSNDTVRVLDALIVTDPGGPATPPEVIAFAPDGPATRFAAATQFRLVEP